MKLFTGQIFTRKEWNDYVQGCIDNDTTKHITDVSKIMVSSIKNIEQEIRCWVVGGRVIKHEITDFKLIIHRSRGKPQFIIYLSKYLGIKAFGTKFRKKVSPRLLLGVRFEIFDKLLLLLTSLLLLPLVMPSL